ncbi:MAG: DNA polymerase I [Ilumatobacteraceae bacterium]
MKVMALDGNSLVYRAFFALPPDMANASGQVTNAVYGFTTMLLNLAKEHVPDGIVVVFDRPEPTFRHEAVPEYKAQREKAPDTLHQQLGIVRELLDAMGIRWLELPGFEGDDIIATIADRASVDGHDVLIVTGDRDAYQLVSDPHVKVLYNKRGVSDYALYDEAGIVERTGVTPAQYPDYAALRGDPSDNLDGVPGVGEKTAAKLINAHGDLDGVLAAAESQTPKLKAGLLEHGERVRRNAAVMVLRRDVPVDVDIASLAPSPDLTAAGRLFDFLEFKTMSKRLADVSSKLGWASRGGAPTTEAAAADETVLVVDEIVDPSVAASMIATTSERILAADWSGDPGRSDLTGLALVVDAKKGRVAHFGPSVVADRAVRDALAVSVPTVAHDAKPLMRVLLGVGGDLNGLRLDTAIGAYLVNPARPGYSLEEVCDDLLGIRPEASGAPDGQLDFGSIDSDAARRCAERALFTARLAPVVEAKLAEIGNTPLYADVENPLVHVLAKMEHAGVAVDVAVLREIRDRLTTEASSLVETLHEVAGHSFNVNSPTQLRTILYDEKGLTPGKKTKTGYSTDAATLEKLYDDWPEFIGPLMRHREVEKLRATYGEGLLAEVNPVDSRIHATFNQTVARTGRLSSDHPNLHNIPVRTDEGRVFRTAFVAPPGSTFLVADYNQIELRCIAHLSGDEGLVSAFAAGEDIHRATAARVFGVNPAKVNHDQRSKAKMVSYGLAYGMEAYGLSQRLAIGVDEAAEILSAYFAAFPRVKDYMDDAVREARQHGYTETLFGRRRPIPELLSDNFRVRQAGERQAMNAAIQGLAADIFKIALVRIDDLLVSRGVRSRVVLQVHDEVIVEVADDERDEVGALVLDTMRSSAELKVPLEVNAAWGATWADAKQ